MKQNYLRCLLAAGLAYSSFAQAQRPVWSARGPDRDDTYRNPALFADYFDPDVLRVGDALYLVASSFDQVPGLPILHSRDLVNWQLLTHALPVQPPVEVYDKTAHGNGVWAPALRQHDGKAYLISGIAASRSGIQNELVLSRMSGDGEHLLDEGTLIIDGRGTGTTRRAWLCRSSCSSLRQQGSLIRMNTQLSIVSKGIN